MEELEEVKAGRVLTVLSMGAALVLGAFYAAVAVCLVSAIVGGALALVEIITQGK